MKRSADQAGVAASTAMPSGAAALVLPWLWAAAFPAPPQSS